jgi:putative methyltransferase (TIGR04325 family)
VLDELMGRSIKYIVVDRTPFSDSAADRLTVQHVPEEIYSASYPCWIFANKGFRDVFRTRYEIIAEFESGDGSAIADGLKFSYAGMILRKL